MPQRGDWLLGQPQGVRDAAATEAWREQARLDAAEVADALVDLTGVSAAESVSRVLATIR